MPMLQVACKSMRPTHRRWCGRDPLDSQSLRVSPSKVEDLPRPENSVEETIKWTRIPERCDQLEGDGGDTIFPIHKNTDLAEDHNDDSTLTIELAAIDNSIGHSGNEIDMTDMENTIDTQADVITHQVIRFASSDNSDVNALSSSLFEYVIVPAVSNDTWIQSNNVELKKWVSGFIQKRRKF